MPRLRITDDEWSFITEMLRIAQQEMLALADTHDRIWKGGISESLRQYAERAADLRERIEQR